MKMSFTEAMLPKSFKHLNWEQVGAVDRKTRIFMLDPHFLKHIQEFQHNRFLSLGKTYFSHKALGSMYYSLKLIINNHLQGKNPRLLWLVKDIMEDLRDQLVFHDHLVASVNDWKSQIREKLKSDKNIIFIGVHNRQIWILKIDYALCIRVKIKLAIYIILKENWFQSLLQTKISWRIGGSSSFWHSIPSLQVVS